MPVVVDASGRTVDHNPNVNPNTNTNNNGGNALNHGGSQTNTAQVNWGNSGNQSASVNASGNNSHDMSYAIAQANAAAAEAERQRQLAEARERARNEQLARENSAKIAREAREKQASRAKTTPMEATTTQAVQQQAPAQQQAQQQQRVRELTFDEVADAGGDVLEQQPMTQSENLGFVDPQTGEVVEMTPDRSSVRYNNGASKGKPGRPRIETTISPRKSKMAEAMEMQDNIPTYRLSDQDFLAGVDDIVSGQEYSDLSNILDEMSAYEDSIPDIGPIIPSRHMNDAYEAYVRDMEAQQDRQGNLFEPSDPNNPVVISPQDVTWRGFQDITGLSGERARKNRIVNNETERQQLNYEAARNEEGSSDINFDAQDRGYAGLDFEADESESHLLRRLQFIQNKMIQRFLNPALLRIEGEYIETETRKVNGKNRTYGRLRYSNRVEGAIGSVRRMYNCSIYNVMQLVQLRAGLGISVDGKIANVDPNEFKLTEDQFVELCRDICESQKQNGHPLGSVTGKPGANGVRDDTGRYVVVAKTRCFPIGYMPTQLINDLRRDWNSQLHQLSERQIQKMVGEQWINETYPTLCANTGGNLMFQARAIENMVRGMMAIDGKNPAELKIPEIEERKTLMALRAEAAATIDPAIREANEIKHRNIEDTLSRWTHKWKKEGGSRFADGGVQSAAMKRRRNKVGDAFRSLSTLERAAKAANIGVMISGVPEALVAGRMQAAANVLSDAVFKGMHGDIAKNYQFTGDLENLSQTKEAIEAREVAESLYRIGGHDAIDVFLGELGDDGRSVYRLTKSDLHKFLQEWGISSGSATISDKVRQTFKIGEGQEAGFLSNVMQILDGSMLGSGMFKSSESKQFIKMSMAEMARASLHGRESYTSSQVADWGSHGGGEELVRSLLQTDAGREAFMTQGITSLGRKSPIEHQLRLIMAKNGMTEFAVRTMFDRFPEYGVNKVLQMIPFSNTLSYLTAHGIKSVGDILVTANDTRGGQMFANAGNAMQRNLAYQVGSRTSFAEGLRKNLLYDTVMAGEKLLIAGVYCGIIMFLGGLQPPDDEKDRYTWSEWKIGKGQDALPVKWAWWMDDLSGVGLPLGMCWAMCMQGDWSDDAKHTATNTFINAVANFNSGTALFDAIDFVNNFDLEWDAASGDGIYGYDVSRDEWWSTHLEQGFWDLAGDLTPTFIGQLVPWSKDYIFRGDEDAHTAGKVYDVGEGSKYSMEEAKSDYRTRRTDSYQDYIRRRSSQTNILEAMFYDWFMGVGDNDSAITGYKYTEQPLDTMVDPYVQAMYDRFSLDLDPATTDIPIDNQEEREAELYSRAEIVCQWIDEHYQNATQANLDGFVLNYDARVNCINYCYHMIDQAWDRYKEATSNGWLEQSAYDAVVDERQNAIEHYQNLIYNYFQSDEIPWSMPRYVRQESDRETRYVDENGNPMTYLDTLGPDAQAHEESYWYGNRPGLLPFTSPRSAGKGYNFETIPYWMVLDEDGNPVNDAAAAYDNAASLPAIAMGRNAGKDVQELMWGGQGTNLKDDTSETLNIPRGGVATIGDRPWRKMEEVFPESLKNLDADTVSKLLGIPSSLPKEDDESEDGDDTDSSSGGNGGRSYGGGRSYHRVYYGGGGGGGYSTYNPRIYSSPRQVYSQRASGMQTRQPYRATTTYLRPSFYTSGSRRAYSRLN